jgi:hypothetical protein
MYDKDINMPEATDSKKIKKIIKIGKQYNLKSKYEKGEIFPVGIKYIVNFKPIYKIESNIGKIADELSRYYLDIDIKDTRGQKVIELKKSNLITVISRKSINIKAIPLDGEYCVEDIALEINNVPTQLKNLKVIDKDYDITSIFLEIEYIGSIRHNKNLMNFDKSRILNKQFLNDIGWSDEICKIEKIEFNLVEERLKSSRAKIGFSILSGQIPGISGALKYISVSGINILKEENFADDKINFLEKIMDSKFTHNDYINVLREKFNEKEIDIILKISSTDFIDYKFEHASIIKINKTIIEPEGINTSYLHDFINFSKNKILSMFQGE